MFIIFQVCYNGRCVEETDLCDGWTTSDIMPVIPGGSDIPCDCTGVPRKERKICCASYLNDDGTCCSGCSLKGGSCK